MRSFFANIPYWRWRKTEIRAKLLCVYLFKKLFILYWSWLTMLWWFQVDWGGSQPYHIQVSILPLFCKEIKPVNPDGNQSWIFFGRTVVEAEAPILWLPDAKSRLIGKDPDAGKVWGQEEKRATEDGMVGWYHKLNEYEFEQTPRDSEGQRSLSMGSQNWTQLRNWTITTLYK